ncbi:MAG: acetylxylan esterase [Planctomycetia bacterium]|nr:acetylxylan esterase [Planctomycetia bacterium]
MKPKYFASAFLFLFLCGGFLLAERVITIELDRPSQVYHLSEKAVFTMTVLDENGVPLREGTAQIRFQNDFRDVLREEKWNLAEKNPLVVEESLRQPGFLSLTVTSEKAIKRAAAGFEPEKIMPAQDCPADFWEFWENLKKEVRELPEELKLEEIPFLCNEKRTVSRLSIRTLDNQLAHGFLSMPKNQGDGPFPLLVMVPGAGPGCGPDTHWCTQGFVVLHMNVFPYPCPLDGAERKKVYDAFHQNLPLRYCYDGAPDRNKYFFRNAYLGIDRAIDAVLRMPQVDATRVGYHGVSQGGASGLILGGLNGKFHYIVASVPALCDHGGGLLGRSPGWPKLYDTVKDPQVQVMGPYFDGENFARRITCPIQVTVGFIDTTCSPSSVYAAYNSIPSTRKVMLHEVKRGHDTGEKHSQAFGWLVENLKK